MKSLLLFIAGAFLFAAATLVPAGCVGGADSVLQASVAFALAFLPATITLAFVLYGFRSTPDMKMIATLAGSGIRMGIAVGGGYLVTWAWPDYFPKPFWNWLILFYLVLLGFEITLLVYAFRDPPAPVQGTSAMEGERREANQDSRGKA